MTTTTGPKGKVQNYETKLNKHTRKLGLLHALSQKLKEGNLMVMNDFLLETHESRHSASILSSVGLSGREDRTPHVGVGAMYCTFSRSSQLQ